MKLIVGLGNPGKEYENTRHNVGFMILDNYLGDVNFKEKMQGLYYEKMVEGEKIIFLKPLTYMNNSGNCVGQFSRYFNVDVDDILVIQDDMDLEIGKFKLKKKSSSGGHNGIKSIIGALDSDDFARFKIGISHNRNFDTKDYVLGKFGKEEMEILKNKYIISREIIDCFIKDGIDKTMNIYNTK